MSTCVWDSWPVELPSAKERLTYPEYVELNDTTFISKMAEEVRISAYDAISKALDGKVEGVAAVLMGGNSEDFALYCSDTDKTEFRQEAFFRHLFQLNEPDCFGALDVSARESYLFVPRISKDAERWNGPQRPLSHYTSTYRVNHAAHVDEIASTLQGRGIKKILLLRGLNLDSGSMTKTTASFKDMELFEIDYDFLHPVLTEVRVHKTPLEIEHLRRCCQMSAKAHTYVMRHIKPGMTELQCEMLYKAYAGYFGAARHMAYTCICGSGPNGAILHYGHAGYPNAKLLDDGDMIVLDMGAEYAGYTTDLTRSYPVNGVFTDDQLKVHNAVRAAQDAVYSKLRPGVQWHELHRVAERVIIEHLIAMNVLVNGTVEEMMENFVGSIFMPHGLGHLLGLNVHDVGGYTSDSQKSSEPGLKWVRLGRALEENMVVTVEPGCYFNKPWILQALEKPSQAKYLNVERLEQLYSFGGVRLEDDILITKDGYENLSGEWPTSAEEISNVITKAQKN